MMEKYITDERTGLKYELVGDYYLVVGDDEPEEDQPIGVWGQRHLRYIREHKRVFYTNLLTSGKLQSHLADIEEQAENMYNRLIEEMAERQGVTETLKAEQPMEWIGLMNNIQACAREVVNNELIYA